MSRFGDKLKSTVILVSIEAIEPMSPRINKIEANRTNPEPTGSQIKA